MLEKIQQDIRALRDKKPLILNLTNYVTMDFMANALLSLGAAPIMSICREEIEDLIKISDAININIGTLSNDCIALSLQAAALAKQQGKPVVLDPVGAGATRLRTQTAKKLLPYSRVVKGNASEILALSGDVQKTHGVESRHTSDQAQDAARHLAAKINGIVVISGQTDVVTDGKEETYIPFGDVLMRYVTGMGCTLSAVIAAFCAINSHHIEACKHATSYFVLCGKLAGKKNSFPGSFRSAFIDELFKADFRQMKVCYDQ